MNITNIKIHVTINPSALTRYQSTPCDPDFVWRKKTKSFITFKNQTFTYVRFFTGFVNITGIKQWWEQESAVSFLETLLKLEKNSFSNSIVDNISSKWTDPLHMVVLFDLQHVASNHLSVISTK